MEKIDSREAAFLSLLGATRDGKYIADLLETWREENQPSEVDFRLAQQIAFGTMQRSKTLDFFASQFSSDKKLNLKTKELLILRMALYQMLFLERIPSHAIVNEAVSLAKKYCHRFFVQFLNAILRKVSQQNREELIKSLNQIEALDIKYSYPPFFIKNLLSDYSLEQTKEILEAQNLPTKVMARVRGENDLNLKIFSDNMALVEEGAILKKVANSANYYIQNATPAKLVEELSKGLKSPKTVLDLCAAPGGKLIAIHDRFPNAELYANDATETKAVKLRENCSKYSINANITVGRGEEYSSEMLFDLIVLDLPCSNTGVLNKRAEARWRISEENLKSLEELQKKLLAHAVTLLAPQGEIWYITCSILKEENEKITDRACEQFGLKKRHEITILPNKEGWDGGYAVNLC